MTYIPNNSISIYKSITKNTLINPILILKNLAKNVFRLILFKLRKQYNNKNNDKNKIKSFMKEV